MNWTSSLCYSCPRSPCCRVLPLHRFRINTHAEFLGMGRLLDYGSFRLGLRDNGRWMVFFTRPCMHLDQSSSKCGLFGKPERPTTCVDFPANLCWYERVFHDELAGPEFILFDRLRFAVLEEVLGFDESGEIDRVPPWDSLLNELRSIPLSLEDTPAPQSPEAPGKFFAFKTGIPYKKEHIGLFRFRLGFPNVGIGIGGDGWYTIVETWPVPAAAGRGQEASAFDLPGHETSIRVGGLALLVEEAARLGLG